MTGVEYLVSWVPVIAVASGGLWLAVALIISSRRAANNRESLLWGIPPTNRTKEERLAGLERNFRYEMRLQLAVIGPSLSGAVALAVAVAGSIQNRLGFLAGALAFVVTSIVFTGCLDVLLGLILISRLASARMRIERDAREQSQESQAPHNSGRESEQQCTQ